MQLSITNDTLYMLAMQKGYEIVITCDDTSHSKQAVFHGKFSVNDSKPYLYGKEWENEEIRRDLVERLLKWAGLRPEITLEHI